MKLVTNKSTKDLLPSIILGMSNIGLVCIAYLTTTITATMVKNQVPY